MRDLSSSVTFGVAVALGSALGACSGTHEALEGSQSALTSNDRAAFDFFLGKGLSAVEAAAIVGNLDQESGMSPSAVQPNGPGRGIAQWSLGARWNVLHDDNATWYAAQHGQSVVSLGLQLDFIWYELSTFSVYGLSALERSSSVASATASFARDFEACGACEQSQRVAYAEAALRAYGGDAPTPSPSPLPPPTPSPAPAPTGGAIACTVPSVGAGVCITTSLCASMSGQSTAGFCPGADDVQCCTGTSSPASGASDGGAPNEGDDAAPSLDASADVPPLEGDASAGDHDAGL
jgi:hypothetical protein